MSRKHTLGMRDIPTIQGLRHRSTPGTREQTVAEVARLEHEKARLRRELDIWAGNQARTEERIRQVEERLVLLQDLLEPAAGSQPRRGYRSRSASDESDDNETRQREDMQIEY